MDSVRPIIEAFIDKRVQHMVDIKGTQKELRKKDGWLKPETLGKFRVFRAFA